MPSHSEAPDRSEYREAAGAKSSDERHGIFSPTSVIVITERTGKLIQSNFVEHRGVPYTILLGTARQQWRVAIYPVPNQLPKERTVFGAREDAVTTARFNDQFLAETTAANRAEKG